LKPDDKELETRRQEMFDRAQKMDALTLAILRAHLLAEQCMIDYILATGVKRRWLRKKTLADKMAKCKLLAKDDGDVELWDVLDAANQLRNTIAHSLSVEKIAEKMKQLKDRYFDLHYDFDDVSPFLTELCSRKQQVARHAAALALFKNAHVSRPQYLGDLAYQFGLCDCFLGLNTSNRPQDLPLRRFLDRSLCPLSHASPPSTLPIHTQDGQHATRFGRASCGPGSRS